MYLWCIVRGINTKACAPTGIAAANVEIEKTSVAATTIHQMFDFDSENVSKLDFAKTTNAKVAALIQMKVLLMDEVSMLDHVCFTSITKCLSDVDGCRRPDAIGGDSFGSVHLILFGDLKQLPPATSQAPFVVLPVMQSFDYRVLRQNRRVVQDTRRQPELDGFHEVLSDISYGKATNAVRAFIVESYVRGAAIRRAEQVEFEGSTAVFTKRRYRDRWNRICVRRISKKHNHSVKIKAKVRSRGTRHNWYAENRLNYIRKKARAQSPWALHLAGDWHHSTETMPTGSKPHLMRTMLLANLAVDQRFANGTAGRLLHWHPASTENKRRAIPACNPDLLARFCKESALSTAQMLPEIHFMDVGARQENLAVKGEPIMLQLPICPAYSLTVHKTQALSIKHLVIGCLEGVFAMGQVYVLVSRCTDPANFLLCGVPPKDLLEDVAAALIARGIDVDKFLEDACSVTREWVYDKDKPHLRDRITVKFISEHSTPVKHRKLEETLNPQPDATVVIHKLLSWMDRVDIASQHGSARPLFQTPEGDAIFPDESSLWWLTDISKRAKDEDAKPDEDGPPSELEEEQKMEVSCSEHGGSESETAPRTPVVAWRV